MDRCSEGKFLAVNMWGGVYGSFPLESIKSSTPNILYVATVYSSIYAPCVNISIAYPA